MPAIVHTAAAAVVQSPTAAAAGIVVLALVTLAVYQLVVAPYNLVRHYRRQGIKGPVFRPIIGNLPEIRKWIKTPYSNRLDAEYGPVNLHMFGPALRVCLNEPELAKQVLVTKADHFVKPPIMKKALGALLGKGLLLLDGQVHHKRRKMVAPAFHFANLKAMMSGMVENTADAMQDWLSQSDVARAALTNKSAEAGTALPEIDMHRELSALTLKIVSRGVFGTDLPGGTTTDDVYDSLNTALDSFIGNITSGAMFVPGFLRLPTKANKKARASVEKLNNMLMRIVRQRREKMLAETYGQEASTDLLALLMAKNAEGALTDEQLKADALTFVTAGHETTAGLMSWTLVMLAKHPEWVGKLRAEIDSVLGGRTPTYPDLANMPLVNAVLLETLRYLPPAANVVRLCTKDVCIGKYHIKAGTGVRVSPYSIHHNPDVWEAPEEWRPERFEHGRRKALSHQLAFLPFSAGKSNCVGQNFAMLEAKTMLIMMVAKLDFVLSPNYVHFPSFQITLRPKFGVPMTVSARSEDGPGPASISGPFLTAGAACGTLDTAAPAAAGKPVAPCRTPEPLVV